MATDTDQLAANARMMRALADELADRVSIRDIQRDKELLNVLLEPVIRGMIDRRADEIVSKRLADYNHKVEQALAKTAALVKEYVDGRGQAIEGMVQGVRHAPARRDTELLTELIELRQRVVDLEALLTPGRPALSNGHLAHDDH
jgi:uncharacterized protein YeeX (DUF496 family)